MREARASWADLSPDESRSFRGRLLPKDRFYVPRRILGINDPQSRMLFAAINRLFQYSVQNPEQSVVPLVKTTITDGIDQTVTFSKHLGIGRTMLSQLVPGHPMIQGDLQAMVFLQHPGLSDTNFGQGLENLIILTNNGMTRHGFPVIPTYWDQVLRSSQF